MSGATRDAGGLDFGAALALLRNGHKVARAGWNGKAMWIRLVNGQAQRPDIKELEPTSDPMKFKITYVYRGELEHLPYLQMKTADDKLVPWLASQTDLLAFDWCDVDHRWHTYPEDEERAREP